MINTVLFETCREVKKINTLKKCVKLVIGKTLSFNIPMRDKNILSNKLTSRAEMFRHTETRC